MANSPERLILLWIYPYSLCIERTDTSSTFFSCSRNYPAAWSVHCQKVNWIPQNGKHGSVINDGINFMHRISGKGTQTLQPLISRSVLFSTYNSELCTNLCELPAGPCSHCPSINPLISLDTHNILFLLYIFTIVFYTSCIPGVLWGSFINTYTQGWDLISLIYYLLYS